MTRKDKTDQPVQPVNRPDGRQAVGIDIGSHAIVVATQDLQKPIKLSLKGDWITDLLKLVKPNAFVAYEPTGWHYSTPIRRALVQHGVTLLTVEHSTTKQIRTGLVSKAKTDQTDAHTLRFIAAMYGTLRFNGVKVVDPFEDTQAVRLRLLVHSYARANKHRTQAINRLRQLVHAVHPRLNLSFNTYLNAARHGYITPSELRALGERLRAFQNMTAKQRAADDLPEALKDGRISRHVLQLIESIPDWLQAEDTRDLIAFELRNWRYFSKLRKRTKALIRETIASVDAFSELAALWMTVPGASLSRVAPLISACHGKVTELKPEEWRAAVGVHPKISQSGESSESIKARPGFKHAKAALHLWTLVLISLARHTPNPVADTFERHKARHHKGAIFAARAKLANILYGIAKNGTPYAYKPNSNA